MSEISHNEKIQSQFTRQAEVYAQTEQAKDSQAMNMIANASGVTDKDKVLDVACGPGIMTAAFASVCKQAIGCDVTDALLNIATSNAQKQGLTNLSFQNADIYNLPFSDGEFDAVVCRAAFHQLEHPQLALQEMVRVLRQGGKIVVGDMLSSNDEAKAAYHNEIERLCDPTHTRALTETEFHHMFAQCKLKEQLIVKSELHYPLMEWIQHGGPDAQTTNEITRRMRASLTRDLTGLKVRIENDELYFSHQAALFVFTLPNK